MQVKKKIIFVLFTWFIFNFSQAQVKINSIEEAHKYALEHNYGHKMQQLKTAQAREQKQTANAFLYPTISAGFNGQYNIDISETPVRKESPFTRLFLLHINRRFLAGSFRPQEAF